jgi:DNA-binding transcriptional LysR family regulator
MNDEDRCVNHDRGSYESSSNDNSAHTRLSPDVPRLRAFLVLAEELHFSRAAARVHLSQPALSQQIATLEKELGAKLFQRSTRRVQLTAAGAHFLAGVRPAIEILDRATSESQMFRTRRAS